MKYFLKMIWIFRYIETQVLSILNLKFKVLKIRILKLKVFWKSGLWKYRFLKIRISKIKGILKRHFRSFTNDFENRNFLFFVNFWTQFWDFFTVRRKIFQKVNNKKMDF